jgi:hypothetical protein
VKGSDPAAGSRALQNVGRVLLSIVVLAGFLAMFVLTSKVIRAFAASRDKLRNQSVYVANRPRPMAQTIPAHPFWPDFPGAGSRNLLGSVINGVPVVSEDWEAGAPAADILAYYRDQMTGLGWQDVTEETYGLRPPGGVPGGTVENENYVSNYRRIMDSNLVVRRMGWSIHLGVGPARRDPSRTAVRILAAATPSIRDFFSEVGSMFSGSSPQPDHPIDVVQQAGGERTHTTVVVKDEAPGEAFQEALAKAGAEGWTPALMLPKQRAGSGYVAWLVRGKAYAILTARALPRERTSAISMVEVSP